MTKEEILGALASYMDQLDEVVNDIEEEAGKNAIREAIVQLGSDYRRIDNELPDTIDAELAAATGELQTIAGELEAETERLEKAAKMLKTVGKVLDVVQRIVAAIV